MPRDASVLARELLGSPPDEIEPILVRPDRATYRITTRKQRFAIKTDNDHAKVAREVTGHRRAAAAGVLVPELVAVSADALAMTWVDGVPLQERSTPAAWRNAGTHVRIAHDVGASGPFGTGFGEFNPARPSWRAFIEAFAETVLEDCDRELGFPVDQAARIRTALRAAAPRLDSPDVVWCHGDLQPDHVLIDPATDRVLAIIDWTDHGPGDAGWDFAVLTVDDDTQANALLDGYGANNDLRVALSELLPLYRVVRLVGEATWLAEHDYPFATSLRRAIEWRP